jgi:outer membrane protein
VHAQSAMKQNVARLGRLPWLVALSAAAQLVAGPSRAQVAPPSPERPWSVAVDSRFRSAIPGLREPGDALEAGMSYTLAELIDLAERRNPETRVAWEQARQQAAALGIAQSALFPTLSALASASVNQYSLFFNKFYREDLSVFPATLNLSYALLDFGRGARIDLARANVLASDFAFNDSHRKVIFQVTDTYYRLLDAIGQKDAAQATLTDAQTVQEAGEARLANGLATLPDVLEARAATAQARYELASVQGLEDIARGALAITLGMRPSVPLHVEDVSRQPVPVAIDEPIEALMDRALAQRPDLLAQVATLRMADAEVKTARASFLPNLTFSGSWGHSAASGQQNLGTTFHSTIFPYQAQLQLGWTIFDGGSRQAQLARAQAERREAQADLTSVRDRIENELWVSYSNLMTTRGRQQAADALLEAATQTYTAMQESYQSGVRTLIDVTSAQRNLARARTAQISARIQLLTSVADLAFRAGELMRAPASGNAP